MVFSQKRGGERADRWAPGAVGRLELVRQQRDALQRAMEAQLVAAVERLTGRTVRTVLSGTSALAEHSVEVFVLDPLSPSDEQSSGLPATRARAGAR